MGHHAADQTNALELVPEFLACLCQPDGYRCFSRLDNDEPDEEECLPTTGCIASRFDNYDPDEKDCSPAAGSPTNSMDFCVAKPLDDTGRYDDCLRKEFLPEFSAGDGEGTNGNTEDSTAIGKSATLISMLRMPRSSPSSPPKQEVQFALYVGPTFRAKTFAMIG